MCVGLQDAADAADARLWYCTESGVELVMQVPNPGPLT